MMVISLLMVLVTTLDPRISNTQEIKSGLFRLSLGGVLGFIIMLLYGLGFPGLQYFFMIVGIGGIVHLFATRRDSTRINQFDETLETA